ncbi:MAG: hypothetical protein AAGA28_19685 [Pseudomonadota bacterium]
MNRKRPAFRLYLRLPLVACLVALCGAPSIAAATVACAVTASAGDARTDRVPLYADPDAASQVIRDIAVGDLVFYPDASLAPSDAPGWVWVRHDVSQTGIWQSGEYGWLKRAHIEMCG